MLRIVIPALLVLGVSCSSGSRSENPMRGDVKVSPQYFSNQTLKTWNDLEEHSGERVTITGKFESLQGSHGSVVMDNNLRINIPHFDWIARGKPWGTWVGKRVQVSGILHTYPEPNPIPGYLGPILQVKTLSDFSVVGN